IDITEIGTQEITIKSWYGGLIRSLAKSFNLSAEFNPRTWFREREYLPPIQLFTEFIEQVLLVKKSSQMVIFLDEIDSLLNVSFKNDFFAAIRAYFNKGAENIEYKRLAFALLGVATPSDLINEKDRTSFNVGQAIELTGFQLEEAQPLMQGLEKIGNPQALMESVLGWTGGQPFLTQKVCKLLLAAENKVVPGKEAAYLENLVREKIIDNWEAQDEPEHLRTIRNRILQSGEKRTGILLGLYQQIVSQGEIDANNSAEHMELRLTRLVVKRDGKLRVYNHIYQLVFNEKWVETELNKLRPYAETFQAWLDSGCKDESRLLRGQALMGALKWQIDKSLSSQDNDFISASQEREKRELEEKLEVQRTKSQLEQEKLEAERTKSQLEQQKQKLQIQKQKTRFALAAGLIIFIFAGIAGFQWKEADKGQIQALATSSSAKLTSNKYSFNALIDALKASKKLRTSFWLKNDNNLKTQVMEALSNAVYLVREKNRLEGHKSFIRKVTFSPNGNTIATASHDKTVEFWNLNGQKSKILKTLKGHREAIVDVTFSPNNKYIATASQDGTAIIWNLQGKSIATLNHNKVDTLYTLKVIFSPDNKIIATTGSDGQIKLWDIAGNPIKQWEHRQDSKKNKKVLSIKFSPDGKLIATGGADANIRLWDKNGQLIHSFSGHTNWIRGLAFSPDSRILASTSADSKVFLWDI
ncbi:MAG: AAA-like domain-containing protein, partial [Cyanobacteria bacterium J06636_27]